MATKEDKEHKREFMDRSMPLPTSDLCVFASLRFKCLLVVAWPRWGLCVFTVQRALSDARDFGHRITRHILPFDRLRALSPSAGSGP
jgi:hypothetical protein